MIVAFVILVILCAVLVAGKLGDMRKARYQDETIECLVVEIERLRRELMNRLKWQGNSTVQVNKIVYGDRTGEDNGCEE